MIRAAVGQEAPSQTRLSHVQAELEVHLPRAAFSEEAPPENPVAFQKTAGVEVVAKVCQAPLVEVGLAVLEVQENFHCSGWVTVELPLQGKT